MPPLKKYESKTKNILLLQVYAKYRREFLNPGVNKQEVWRKIAHEMKEKGSFNHHELLWCRKVAELRQEYEKIKYIPATSGEIIDFKIAAKNAFQNIENPVPGNSPAPETSSLLPFKKYERKMESVLLLQVYAKYKREFLNPYINKKELWRKIVCEMKEKGCYIYDESILHSKVEELRQDYERIKYIPVTNGEMVDFKIAAKNAFETTGNPVIVVPNKVKMAMQMRKQLNKGLYLTAVPNKVRMAMEIQKMQLNERLFERNITLLTLYTLHKDEFNVNAEGVWKKIAEKMNEKFPKFKCRPLQCRDIVFSMRKRYKKRIKNKNSNAVTDMKDAIFLKKAKLAFNTKTHPATFMDEQKREKQLASLKAFNMYKAQFLSPDANQQELWQKITETVNKLSLRNNPYTVTAFRNHLCDLKLKYDNMKTGIIHPENAIFFEEAKLVFESTESEAISVDQILLEGHNRKIERHLALLRAYNIYKEEFSSPNEDDESVWEKIAGTVRISCSLDHWTVHDCRLNISQLKVDYEKKKRTWCPAHKADVLYEEEKLAFETNGYPEEHEQLDLLTEINTNSV